MGNDQKTPTWDETTPTWDATTAVSSDDADVVSKYLDKKEPSMGESALAGAQQALTLNHTAQLGGLMGAAMEKAAGSKEKLSDLYDEYKKANAKRVADAQQANPISFGAGAVGGGLLGFAGAGMAAKPAMAALGQVAPAVAGTAKIMNAAAPGAIPLAAAGAAAAQGANPDVPITSQQGVENMSEGAAENLIGAAAIPPAIQKVAAGAQKTAQGAKFLGKSAAEMLTGGLGTKAFQRGLQGESVVGKQAAQNTADQMLQFGKQVPQTIEDQLNQFGAQKLAIIRSAQDAGVTIDPADIDNFLSQHLNTSSPSSLANAQREMSELHELIQTAQSGPEVQQIVRRYFGQGNTEKGQFAQLFSKKQAEMEAAEADNPPVPLTQKQAFEQKFDQMQAEQTALPGGKDPTPYELTYEPIQDSNDVMGVIRQPQYDTDGHFIGYKKIASQSISPDAPSSNLPKMRMIMRPTDVPNKSLGMIQQAQYDQNGLMTGYKTIASKLLTEDEGATWKDMAETVRTGQTPDGQPTDLSQPEQLYQLYKDLKAKSQYGNQPFTTEDAKNATSNAIDDIQTLLRNSIDELQPTDQKIAALKNAQQIINAQDKDPETIMKTVAALMGRTEDTTIAGADARNKLANLVNQIKIANPALGHQIESQAQNLADKFAMTGAAQGKVYLPRPLATPKALAVKGANILGYTIGQVTPEWMQNVAGTLLRQGGKAQQMLSNVLSQAASKDTQTRNAIMFGLMQQPAYRDILKDYMSEQQPTEPGGRKNKETQLYK